jgi:hypothetical protein
MLQEVTATIDNCLQLCQLANEQYAVFLENLPDDELDIITWRVNYISLDEFDFPVEYQNKTEVLLFKDNYDKSIVFFYDLMETNERNNQTERVHLSLSTFPDVTLFHSFLTAVAPKQINDIDLQAINQVLSDKKYESFYNENLSVIIDVNQLSVPAISAFVNSNGEVVTGKIKGADIIGQLIINSEKQVDFIGELFKAGVRGVVERVN